MSEKIPLYQLEQLYDEPATGVGIFNFSHRTVDQHASKASTPHRHDHYCCFFVEEGMIDFHIDFQPVLVLAKSLLVSYPGQVHQSGVHHNCAGWLLIFDAKLVNETARMIIEESLTKVTLLKLDDGQDSWFKKLFELLESIIYQEEKTALHGQLTRSLLDSFLYQVCLLHQSQEDTRMQQHSSRNIDIANRFRRLVKENFKTIKKPLEYAEKMNFSVSYLNDTVKAITGFSLTYLIQQEIVGEAQRLLFYSEMTVKEVAYALGYEDDKYFIRVFGKATGISPAHFRKSQKRTT